MNPAQFPIETPEKFPEDQINTPNLPDLPLLKENYFTTTTTKTKGKGRPKKLETILKDIEKTYKSQLIWLERKDNLKKARERLAELMSLKSKKRKDEIKILEAQIEEACQWEKAFAATKEAGGSITNLLEKMDRVKFKTEGMTQALEYKRDWDLWFATASSLDKKCSKKKKDMTEAEEIEQEFDMIKSLRKVLKEEKHLKYKESDKGLSCRLKDKLKSLKFIHKSEAVPEVPTKLFNSQIFDFYKNFETLLNVVCPAAAIKEEEGSGAHLGQKLASNCLDYNIEHLATLAQLLGSVEAFSKQIPEMADLQIIYDKLTLVLRIHSTLFQKTPQEGEDPFAYAKELNKKTPKILQQESLTFLQDHSLSDAQQKTLQELCQNLAVQQKSLSFKNNLDQTLLDYFQEILKLTTSQSLRKQPETPQPPTEVKVEEEKTGIKSSDNKVAKQAYRVIELFFQKTLPDICEKYDKGADYENNCRKIEELCNKYLRLEEELAGKQDKDKELQKVRQMIERILACFKWLTKLFKKQNNIVEKWTYEELTHAIKILSECKIPYNSKVVNEMNTHKIELEINRKEYHERYGKKRMAYLETKQDQLTIEEAKSTLIFINNAPNYLDLEQEKKQIEQDIQAFTDWKNDLQKLTQDWFPPKCEDFCNNQDQTFEDRFNGIKKSMSMLILRNKKADKLYKPLSWLYEVSVTMKSQKGSEEEAKLKALYNAGEKLAEIRPDLGVLGVMGQIKEVLDTVEQVAALYGQIKELKRDFERKVKIKWEVLERVVCLIEKKRLGELNGSKYLNQVFNGTRNLKDRTEQLLSASIKQEITIKEVKSIQEALKKNIVSLDAQETQLNELLKNTDDLLKFCRNRVAISSIEKIDELAERYNKLPIRIEEIEQRLKEFEGFKEKYKNIQKRAESVINKKMSFEEMDELKSKIHELEAEIPEDKFLERLKTQIFLKRCKLLKELKDHKFSAGFLRGILLEGKSLKEQNSIVKENIQFIEERLYTEQKKTTDSVSVIPRPTPVVKYNPLVPISPPPKVPTNHQENADSKREKYLREIALEIVEKCQNYGVTFKQGLDYAHIITNIFPNLLESDVDFPKGMERLRGLLQFPNIAKDLIHQKFEANYFKKLIKQNQQELKMLDHKLSNGKDAYQLTLDIPAPQKKVKPNSLQTIVPSLNKKGIKSNQILAQSSVKEKVTNYNINVLTSFNFYAMDDSSSERKGNLLQRITQAKDFENPKQETHNKTNSKEARSVITDDEIQIAHDEVFSQDEQEDKNTTLCNSKKEHEKKFCKQPGFQIQQEEDFARMPENPILYDPDETQHQRAFETIKKHTQKDPIKDLWNPKQGSLIENLDEIASLRGDQILKVFDGVLKFEEDNEILPKITLFTCDPYHTVTNIPELTRDGYSVLKVTERLSMKKFEFYLGTMFEKSTTRDKQIISGWIESPIIGSQGHGGCFKMAKKLRISKKIGVFSFHESAKLFVMHRKQMTSEWKHKLNFAAKKVLSNAKPDLYFIVIHKPYKIRYPIKSIAPEVALAFDHQPKSIGMEYLDNLAQQEKSDKESSITLDNDLDYQVQTEKFIKGPKIEKEKISSSSSQNKKVEPLKQQNLNDLPSLNGKRKLEEVVKDKEEDKKVSKETIADPRKRLKIEKMEREAALKNENAEKKTTNPLAEKFSSMGKRTLCKTLKGMNQCEIFELSSQIDDKTRGNIISVLKAADQEDQNKIEEETIEVEKITVTEESNENQPSQGSQGNQEENKEENKLSDEKPIEIEEAPKPFPQENIYEQQEFDMSGNMDQAMDFIGQFYELFTVEEMMQAKEKVNMAQVTSIVKKRPFAIFSSKSTN